MIKARDIRLNEDVTTDKTSGVIVATVTVSNTVTETTILTESLTANVLKAGNVLELHADGIITNATAVDDITINVYIGSTLVETLNPAIGNVTDAHWHVDGIITIRTAGAGGTLARHFDAEIDGNADETIALDSIDTTVAEDITVKVQWDNAKAGNTISIYQGYLEFKN